MSTLKKIIVSFSLLLCFFFSYRIGYFNGTNNQPKQIVQEEIFLDANKLFELSNEWRISQGLKPYIKLELLCDSAKIRNIEVQTNWSHEGFSAEKICGKGWCQVGENLAKDLGSEKNTFSAWLTSSTHLENLEYNFKYSCVSTSGEYAVQHFGNF